MDWLPRGGFTANVGLGGLVQLRAEICTGDGGTADRFLGQRHIGLRGSIDEDPRRQFAQANEHRSVRRRQVGGDYLVAGGRRRIPPRCPAA
jgi:hypothetical protein